MIANLYTLCCFFVTIILGVVSIGLVIALLCVAISAIRNLIEDIEDRKKG